MIRERRYRPLAWVSKTGDVTPLSDEGYQTLRQLFLRLPTGVRWAVVHCVEDPPPFHAIDMWDLKTRLPQQMEMSGPMFAGRVLRFDEIDPAIVAAVSHE